MLNLKVRVKQQWFWITLIPLLFLFFDQVIQFVQAFQAYTIGDILAGGTIEELAIKIIGVLFSILALIGFPVDLTTDGYGDSARALDYTEPAPNASETAEIEFQENETKKKIVRAQHVKNHTVDEDD